MKMNNKRYRQMLPRKASNNNNTDLKPKIQLVSNYEEKLNLNYNVLPKIESSIELKQESEPILKIEIIYQEPPCIGLAEQLLLEEQYDSSIFEDDSEDDNISVGVEYWNEFLQTHKKSDMDSNDRNNSIPIKAANYKGHKQLADEKINKECSYDLRKRVVSVINNYPAINISKQTRKTVNLLEKPLPKINQPSKHTTTENSSKRKIIRKALEQKLRDRLATGFNILRDTCESSEMNRRGVSKVTILMAAKRECEWLRNIEKDLLIKKKTCFKKYENLMNKKAEIIGKSKTT
uniref:BHLH domain-containing protein n=1 Tax=Schizaphis graminum TaxID=13262 RepID=A0A2S2PUT5_SCHGA